MRPSSLLVLASASPRRRSILEDLGLQFDVCPSPTEEPEPGSSSAVAHALASAEAKARAVMASMANGRRTSFVLGADTVVAVDDGVLGKPRHRNDAHDMIRRLAGRWHETTTAVVVGRACAGVAARVHVTTDVRFRELSAAEIEAYLDTDEWQDKAGAYGIQGAGGNLVAARVGSRSNVVGLPAAETLQLLARCGAVESWP